MRYAVVFTFSGCVFVDADLAETVESRVEDMSDGELLAHADFKIQSVEEVEE